MEEDQTPEERAEAAARYLADVGKEVTARAVSSAAKVRMHVAASVAKAWNDVAAEDTNVELHEVPAHLQGKLAAIWVDGYITAGEATAQELDQLRAKVEQLHEDADACIEDLQKVDDTERTLQVELTQAYEQVVQAKRIAQADVNQAQLETAKLKGQLEQLQDENSRLTTLIHKQLRYNVPTDYEHSR